MNRFQISQKEYDKLPPSNRGQYSSTLDSPEVVFLLGAGASKAAGVPTMYEFVDQFMDKMELEGDGEGFEHLEYVYARLSKWQRTQPDPKPDGKRVDLELLLGTLRRLNNLKEEPLTAFYEENEEISGSCKIRIKLQEELEDFIRQKCLVEPEKIEYLKPLRDFCAKYRPLHIFSLNYDVCIEQMCSLYGIEYADGFGLDWEPERFGRDNAINLYKIHGSTTWYRTDRSSYVKLPLYDLKSRHRLITGEMAETLMVYPVSDKPIHYEPLSELIQRFRTLLGEARLCIVVGYSFRDEHIKRMLFEAVRKNKKLKFYIVAPHAFEIFREELRGTLLEDRAIPVSRGFEDILTDRELYECVQRLLEASNEPAMVYKASLVAYDYRRASEVLFTGIWPSEDETRRRRGDYLEPLLYAGISHFGCGEYDKAREAFVEIRTFYHRAVEDLRSRDTIKHKRDRIKETFIANDMLSGAIANLKDKILVVDEELWELIQHVKQAQDEYESVGEELIDNFPASVSSFIEAYAEYGTRLQEMVDLCDRKMASNR